MPVELRELIAKREGLILETKETPSEEVLSQFSKFCASFANAQGGSIIIGVNNDGRIVGANIDRTILERISAEAANCKPPVTVQLNLYQEGGRTVLQVYVHKSTYIHADKSFRFPLRTGNVTSFMELGSILAYAKERKLVGEGPASEYQARQRRKPETDEMKLFTKALSHKDPKVRAHVLNQLSSMVFNIEIEIEKGLLSSLVRLLQDTDARVRLAALMLYEKLTYHLPAAEKVRYNKKLLSLAYRAAMNDNDKDIRKQAIVTLAVTGDERAAKAIVATIIHSSEEEYKSAIPGHVWNSMGYSRLGPKLRRKLMEEYVKNNSEEVRRRIEEITSRYYLG